MNYFVKRNNLFIYLILCISLLVIIPGLLKAEPKTDAQQHIHHISQLIEKADSLADLGLHDSATYYCTKALNKAEEQQIDSLILRTRKDLATYSGWTLKPKIAIEHLRKAQEILQKNGLSFTNEMAEIYETLCYYLNSIDEMESVKGIVDSAIEIREYYTDDNCLNPLVAYNLRNTIYLKEGDSTSLRKNKEFVLEYLEDCLAEDSANRLKIMSRIVAQLYQLHRLEEAEKICGEYIDSLKAHNCEVQEIINAKKSLISILRRQNKLDKLFVLLDEVVSIYKSQYGPGHSKYAGILQLVGKINRDYSNYDSAESVFSIALEIYEESGQNCLNQHQEVLKELGRIAIIQGRYEEGLNYLNRALEILVKGDYKETPALASVLNYYGNAYKGLGLYDTAKSCYLYALDIRKIDGPLETSVAEPANNLGELYILMGLRDNISFDTAKTYFDMAFKARSLTYGSNHIYLLYTYIGKGKAHYYLNEYHQAESLFLHSKKICESSLCDDHEHLAWAYEWLGNTYMARGLYEDAKTHFDKALKIYSGKFGIEHSRTIPTVQALAHLHGSSGNYDSSLTYYNKLLNFRQKFVSNVFSYSIEEQKRRFLKDNPLVLHSLISLALKSEKAKPLALEMILKGKAAIIEASTDEKQMTFCSDDLKIHSTMDYFDTINEQISTLTIRAQIANNPKKYINDLGILYAIRDSLEHELLSCLEFKDYLASTNFNIEDITNELDSNSLLLEYICYSPYSFDSTGNELARTGSPRYLGLALDYAGNIEIEDLGTSEPIDKAISNIRQRINESPDQLALEFGLEDESELKMLLSNLKEILIGPFDNMLSKNKELYICPDGQLNLIPFEILCDSSGQYLIEKTEISYLSSGSDLIKYRQKDELQRNALIIADPDFDSINSAINQSYPSSFTTLLSNTSSEDLHSRASTCFNSRFFPINQTRIEADSIYRLLKSHLNFTVHLYTGINAREQSVKDISDDIGVLHLATHGVFCDNQDTDIGIISENPLLRSGLIFAGANRNFDNPDDPSLRYENGILTAFEISGLNLSNIELVVLSACKTAMGKVENGEGVYGLRRSFQMAGAESIIMSLWNVPDTETRKLMTSFYRNWISSKSKKKALRKSILEIMDHCRDRYNCTHPYIWGSFVLLGSPD